MESNKRIEVIDGGYVELLGVLHTWSTPEDAICRSARVSHGNDKYEYTTEQNVRLIHYLMEHYHTSPFEQVEFVFYIRLPYYLNTQFLRHRTANINAESRRYRDAGEEEFDRYWHSPVVNIEDVRLQHKSSHQSSYYPEQITEKEEKLLKYFQEMEANTNRNWELYRSVIDEGGSKELARVYLPEAAYTVMHWKMDLHNLLHFLRLRLAPDSQLEIRKYANAIFELITPYVPNVIDAFKKYRLNSLTFNATEVSAIEIRIRPDSKLTKREKEKLYQKLEQHHIIYSE